MNYGLPYMGSKNKIARDIVEFLPPAKHFYDLFCGGCAVTHAAMFSGKYETFFINDIAGDMPQLFVDSLRGKFRNETRWISREEFEELKDTDAYVRTCWSFGNNGQAYLYSKEIEPWKKALHYARVFHDYSVLREFGIDSDGSPDDVRKHHEEYKAKYIAWYVKNVLKSDADVPALMADLEHRNRESEEELRQYLRDALKASGLTQSEVNRRLGTNGMAKHYFSCFQWEFPTREMYNRMREFMPLNHDYEEIYGLQELLQRLRILRSLESLQNLQNMESLQRLQRLQRLENANNVKLSSGDYKSVEILPDSIVYCDPPYFGTAEYKDGGFDYQQFWEWVRTRDFPVYVSEYSAPEDFVPVWNKEKTCSYSGSNNRKKTIEHVFLHRRFIAESVYINSVPVQLELAI